MGRGGTGRRTRGTGGGMEKRRRGARRWGRGISGRGSLEKKKKKNEIHPPSFLTLPPSRLPFPPHFT